MPGWYSAVVVHRLERERRFTADKMGECLLTESRRALEMSRAPQRFKQSELQRVIRAIQKEGGNMTVEISPDKTIRIVPDRSAQTSHAVSDQGQIVL